MASNTLKSLAAGFTALGLAAATPAFAEDAPKKPIQVAQSDVSAQQVSFTEATGKPVQFIHGSKVNSYNLQRVVESVEEAGCPVTTRELSSNDRIIVRVDGKTVGTQDPVFAGVFALDHCN